MDYKKNKVDKLVMASLILSGIFVFFAISVVFSHRFQPYRRLSSNVATVDLKDELERALEAVSMANKTVIITVVNKAYANQNGMLDLFLRSFREGEGTQFLTRHLLIVATDQTAFDRCNVLGLHCYKLVTEGVDFSTENLYMSKEFIGMMWTRTLFLADVLKRGYNFVFTDTDVMWLRNPFAKLGQGSEDLQISCDSFNIKRWNTTNPINTGFYSVRSSNKTIALFDEWYSERNNSLGKKEQDVLAQMISHGVLRGLGLRVRFLDTRYFGGFCQNSRDLRDVITMHSNCCRTINAKLVDLTTVLEDWKNFIRPSSNATTPGRWFEHKSCSMSWKN